MNPTIRSKIIFVISSAMKRLHNLSIIHGELYFNNILLDEKSEPPITDFSTSRKTTDESVLGISCGVPLCMTPEFLNGDYEKNGTPSVAFSYEMLLYFMFTTDIIFHEKKKFNLLNNL